MESASLDFGAASGNAASAVVIHSSGAVYAAVLGAILLYLLLSGGSAVWLLARAGGVASRWSLASAPASVRAVALLAIVSLGLAQLFGGIDAYVQTQQLNESTLTYFQYLSSERLLGMSHSHLFGFFVSFGVQAALLTGTGLSERTKTWAVSLGLWAGVADVGSWWGIRNFDGRFEWLSMVCGVVSGCFILLVTVAVIRAVHQAAGEE